MRSAVEFFHAVLAIAADLHGLDADQTRGLRRVAHAGLGAAAATEAAWERVFKLAADQARGSA